MLCLGMRSRCPGVAHHGGWRAERSHLGSLRDPAGGDASRFCSWQHQDDRCGHRGVTQGRMNQRERGEASKALNHGRVPHVPRRTGCPSPTLLRCMRTPTEDQRKFPPPSRFAPSMSDVPGGRVRVHEHPNLCRGGSLTAGGCAECTTGSIA